MGKTEGKGNHCWGKLILVLMHLSVYAMLLTFNYLSSEPTPIEVRKSLYGNASVFRGRYDTDLTPASWVFGTVWTIIYVWQAIHIFYSISLLLRKTPSGDHLYVNPGHIGLGFYSLFMANNGFVTGWLFLFAKSHLIWAFVFLVLSALTLYGCGFFACRGLNSSAADLIKYGLRRDIWLTRILTINGITFYGTWVTIASLLNMYIVMHYVGGVEKYICNWVVLSVLILVLLAWFVLETFILDRHLRYIFTPYIVLILAFVGVINKFYDPNAPESYLYFVMALLALSSVLAIVKLAVMFIKGHKIPIVYNNFYEDTETEAYRL